MEIEKKTYYDFVAEYQLINNVDKLHFMRKFWKNILKKFIVNLWNTRKCFGYKMRIEKKYVEIVFYVESG